jgi:hypothetical protein
VVDGQQQDEDEPDPDPDPDPDALGVVLDIPFFFVIMNPDEEPRTLVISKVAEIFFLTESTDKCLLTLHLALQKRLVTPLLILVAPAPAQSKSPSV